MADQLSLLELFAQAPPHSTMLELWTPDEIFAALSAGNVHRFIEDNRIERKSARKSPKDLADDLSAFANAQPHGGVILVGIEDNGRVTGFAGLGLDRASEFEGRNPNCPDAQVETKRIEVVNSKRTKDFVVAIRVHYRADRLVETTSFQAFVRAGKEKIRLTEPEKREIRINKGEIDYELDPVALRYPDDFSKDLIALFCQPFGTAAS